MHVKQKWSRPKCASYWSNHKMPQIYLCIDQQYLPRTAAIRRASFSEDSWEDWCSIPLGALDRLRRLAMLRKNPKRSLEGPSVGIDVREASVESPRSSNRSGVASGAAFWSRRSEQQKDNHKYTTASVSERFKRMSSNKWASHFLFLREFKCLPSTPSPPSPIHQTPRRPKRLGCCCVMTWKLVASAPKSLPDGVRKFWHL